MNTSDNRRIVLAALVLFAALRLAAMSRYPLWTDETWTLQSGIGSFRAMLRLHADDQTHPPLYYATLWIWRRLLPDALEWQRLLASLAGIATAVPLVVLAKRAGFSRRATILGVLMGAGSGMLVMYSAEIRNYAFLAFFATASLALWLRERDAEAPRFRALTLVNILLVYSHYFGVFVVLAEVLDAWFGARRRLPALMRSAAIAILSLTPWVAETFRRAGITGGRLDVVSWIAVPEPGDVLDVVRESVGGVPAPEWDLLLASATVLLVSLWSLRMRGTERWSGVRLLLLAVATPVAITWVASVAGPRPMWVSRYLIAAAPPLVLLVAGAIDWAVPRRLSAMAVMVAMIPGALTVASLVRGREKPRYDLAMSAMLAHEQARPVDVLTLKSVDGFPVLYLDRQIERENGERLIRSDDIPPGSRIAASTGWLIWNEVHPPRGITPTAMLVRQGFQVGPELGFGAARDSLVAVRFERRAGR